MALTLGDNFSYGGAKPLDARLKYATTTEMKTVADATMYDGCLAYCSGTDKTYQWKSTNTVDATLGKWREFSTGTTITVDSALSDSSTNPVQNKVVKSAIDGKVSTSATAGLLKNDGTVDTKTYIESSKAYSTDDSSFTGIDDADYVPVYDTSDTAKKKTLWSNIKSVLKTYFDTLYNMYTLPTASASTLGGVKIGQNLEIDDGVLNGVIPVMGTFSREGMYSTTEKIVGCWIDGKPLYQKVLKFKTPSSVNTTTYANIGASVDTAISYYATFKGTAGTWIFADSNSDVNGHRISAQVNSNSHSSQPNAAMVVFGPNALSSWFNLDVYFIVYYTKTTDAANSFKWGDENDYSTTEHVVGTWIDNKPVYQKTIDFGAGPNNTRKSVAHGITNLKDVVNMFGIGKAVTSYWSMGWNSDTKNVFFGIEGSNLYVEANVNHSSCTYYFTIQYTKTTD